MRLYSILIVELSNHRWSYAIARDDKRIYSSSASWSSPEETWNEALYEYHSRLKLSLNN